MVVVDHVAAAAGGGIAGVGIVISLIGTFFVKISSNDAKESEVQKALNIGNWASILIGSKIAGIYFKLVNLGTRFEKIKDKA